MSTEAPGWPPAFIISLLELLLEPFTSPKGDLGGWFPCQQHTAPHTMELRFKCLSPIPAVSNSSGLLQGMYYFWQQQTMFKQMKKIPVVCWLFNNRIVLRTYYPSLIQKQEGSMAPGFQPSVSWVTSRSQQGVMKMVHRATYFLAQCPWLLWMGRDTPTGSWAQVAPLGAGSYSWGGTSLPPTLQTALQRPLALSFNRAPPGVCIPSLPHSNCIPFPSPPMQELGKKQNIFIPDIVGFQWLEMGLSE